MKRSFISLIYGLLKLVGPFIYVILIAVFNGVLGFIFAMNITIFAGLAILKFLGIQIALSYTWLFIIIIASGILRGIVRYFEQYSNHYTAFKLLAILRDKIFTALRKIAPAKLDDKNKGELISLLQSDIETLEVFYAHTISPALIAIIISGMVSIFLSIFVNIYIGLLALLSYILIGIIIPVIFYKKNNRYGRDYRSRLGEFDEFYLDSIYGCYEVIGQGKQELRKEFLTKNTEELLVLNANLERKNNFFKNLTNTVIIVLNFSIILLSGVLYKFNIISSPFIFFSYIVLTSSFGSVIALANLPNNLAMTFASGNRVLDLLAEEPAIKEGNLIQEFEFNELTLQNVSFSYKEKKILNNLNLQVKHGEIVGILGPSGVGKSTILKLIMHFYPTSSGSILINGSDINNYSHQALYANINLFSQSTYLFNDTIKNNLLIAKPDASLEEIKEACKKANILKFIEELPNGFEEKINDKQDNISSGEKQRIGLARIFLRQPKLLLLDEATANIDAINEGIILNALKKYSEQTAIIIISHRKSTLAICDSIYAMKEGRLCLQ